MTAKVFSAFMIEGVINQLGATMCPTWAEPRQQREGQCRRPSLSREPFPERHKFVRHCLHLTNGDGQYEEIRALLGRLIRFRDAFAHPKEHRESIDDYVQSDMVAVPDIEWEKEINATDIESEYQELERYSMSLLRTAAERLESTLALGWEAWQQQYPHLGDLGREARSVRTLLQSPRTNLRMSELDVERADG